MAKIFNSISYILRTDILKHKRPRAARYNKKRLESVKYANPCTFEPYLNSTPTSELVPVSLPH